MKFKIGKDSTQFRIFDDEDKEITDLCVKSMRFEVDGKSGDTLISLELYANSIDIDFSKALEYDDDDDGR